MNADVRTLSLFQSLSAETLSDIERAGVVQSWSNGAIIFRENDKCLGLHVVVAGTVKLFRRRSAGEEQIVLVQGAGTALSTVPLLDRKGYPLNAEAVTVVTTLLLPTPEYNRISTIHPDFHDAILVEVATRHRKALTLLANIALKSVPARVATLVLEYARAANALESGVEFEMLLTQEELAQEVATTREGVARALARLRRDGVIAQQGARIRVHDAARLEQLAEIVRSVST